ncbi:MAG: hypothetical protein GXO07_05665 [Crenarchaeota archaeon]|nr:hypothetical protein [Thermoproteota archaeon]
MNVLTVFLAFILLALFIQSGHVEVLFAFLLLLGIVPPEQLAALARQLGKFYYGAKKVVSGYLDSGLNKSLGKLGEWRSRRLAELSGERAQLIKKLEEVLEEPKKP